MVGIIIFIVIYRYPICYEIKLVTNIKFITCLDDLTWLFVFYVHAIVYYIYMYYNLFRSFEYEVIIFFTTKTIFLS